MELFSQSAEIPKIGLSIFSSMKGIRAAYGLGKMEYYRIELRRYRNYKGTLSELPPLDAEHTWMIDPGDSLWLCLWNVFIAYCRRFITFELVAQDQTNDEIGPYWLEHIISYLWHKFVEQDTKWKAHTGALKMVTGIKIACVSKLARRMVLFDIGRHM